MVTFYNNMNIPYFCYTSQASSFHIELVEHDWLEPEATQPNPYFRALPHNLFAFRYYLTSNQYDNLTSNQYDNLHINYALCIIIAYVLNRNNHL